MKYFNYVLSLGILILSLYLFVISRTEHDFLVAFITMLTGIIFFLFALLEERKEEIEELRQTILKHRGV